MNTVIIATGSNIGDSANFLKLALNELQAGLTLIEKSRVYTSPAVDYLNQPDFLNQVLHFSSPENKTPFELLEFIQEIELKLGRKREIDKGPRTIDIDILFFNELSVNEPKLQIPHPRLFQRSFIVLPLKELSIFDQLNRRYDFPSQFDNTCTPLTS